MSLRTHLGLIDKPEFPEDIIEGVRQFIPGQLRRRRNGMLPCCLKLPGQFERKLYSGQIETALLHEVFHLTQSFDVVIRVESKIAGGTGRRDKAFSLILAQRLGMHFNEARRNTDYEQRL